jgi:hypothetical protein
MRKILFTYLLVILSVNLFAQQIPTEFNLASKRLAKTSDQTPVSNTIERILIKNNIIFLATSEGLSTSTNNGDSWTNYIFGTENVSSVGFNDGIIWAATWHMENLIGSDVPVGTGLRFSSDAGATWKEIPQPVDTDGDSTIIYGSNKLRALPITVRPGNFIYDIGFTRNTIWIVSYYGGLRSARIDSLISSPR